MDKVAISFIDIIALMLSSHLFEKGSNVMEVASITGHKDVHMLYRYTHPLAETLAQKLQ